MTEACGCRFGSFQGFFSTYFNSNEFYEIVYWSRVSLNGHRKFLDWILFDLWDLSAAFKKPFQIRVTRWFWVMFERGVVCRPGFIVFGSVVERVADLLNWITMLNFNGIRKKSNLELENRRKMTDFDAPSIFYVFFWF